jgi:ankyrin repeat protein
MKSDLRRLPASSKALHAFASSYSHRKGNMNPSAISSQLAHHAVYPSPTLADLPSDIRFQMVRALIPADVTAASDLSWYMDVRRFAIGIETAVLVPLLRQWSDGLINQLTLEQERVLSMAADILRDQAMTLPHEAGTQTVLMVAAQTGDPHLINRLLMPFSPHLLQTGFVGLPPQLNISATDDLGRTAMHFATQMNCASSIYALAAAGGSIDAQDNYGWTPLHYASAFNHEESMYTLIELHANLNLPDNQDFTPLAIAESFEHNAATLILTAAEARNDHPAVGYSALHIASNDVSIEMAMLLLALRHPVDPPDEFGRTPFLHAASRGNVSIMSALIDAGANINTQDDSGLSALHVAVEENQIDAIFLLLQRGANLLARDAEGDTPYDIAHGNGDAALADLLLSAQQRYHPQVPLPGV